MLSATMRRTTYIGENTRHDSPDMGPDRYTGGMSLPETTPGVVVWCLPEGMKTARLVVQDENGGPSAARTIHIGDLMQLRTGIDEALDRMAKAYCADPDWGYFYLASLGPICARCGERSDDPNQIPTAEENAPCKECGFRHVPRQCTPVA